MPTLAPVAQVSPAWARAEEAFTHPLPYLTYLDFDITYFIKTSERAKPRVRERGTGRARGREFTPEVSG